MTFKIDTTKVPLLFQIFYSLVPKTEVCLKYFLEKIPKADIVEWIEIWERIWRFQEYFNHIHIFIGSTGTPPLTQFFGPGENRVKGKPRYRRSILVLKP